MNLIVCEPLGAGPAAMNSKNPDLGKGCVKCVWRHLIVHLCHLRGTGPWKVKGFNLMSLFLSSFTPTPEAPVHKGATNRSHEAVMAHLERKNKEFICMKEL